MAPNEDQGPTAARMDDGALEQGSHEQIGVEQGSGDGFPASPRSGGDFTFQNMSDDTDASPVPPAHLVARFYRTPHSRRKSSAASSRRNSLSSTHSHGSSRSLRRHSSSHSNYVAQQLRRTSILETRKARLADRAAHAEQVRLRAALAKAAPRGNATSSEERALAAQIAREKYLAKVAASCAEEVQRAKQIAQEMKARKLAEEQKCRQDMEERLAEADRRRTEYQRNLHARRARRASSQEKKLAVVVEDTDVDTESGKDEPVSKLKLDDDTAARRIQRTWRTRRRRTVFETYVNLNVTIDGLRDNPFEVISSIVADPKVMHATSSILHLFGLEQDLNAISKDTRAFLSAYLIVIHPTSVLSKRGAQEEDLINKAQELIVLLESAVGRLAAWNRFYPSQSQTEDLSQAYSTYTAAFDAWKTQDSSLLVETMVASFVELDGIWQSVKDDTQGGVADDYREGIRDNQVILLSKIRKLAGPERADFLIKKAIRESRRRRGKRRTAAEVRPRVAEDSIGDASEEATSSTLEGEVLQSSPVPGEDTNLASSFAKMCSALPTNRLLTHELAINKEYRIPSTANKDTRKALHNKLRESMEQGIENGQSALWVSAMAECLRGKLLGVLKPGNSMHVLLSESLDTEHIYRQCAQNVFDYGNFFGFMARLLPKLCAPFRDDQVKHLADYLETSSDSTQTMIDKLFRILEFADLLSLDHSNFLLMGAAPTLIKESAGYEQRMFAKDLESGVRTLQNAKRWWRNASVNLLTEADRRDPEQIRLAADRPNARKIYFRGLVDLTVAQSQPAEADFPETLHLDVDRLCDSRRNAMAVVTIGSLLLTAKNLLKRDVRSPWKAEASRLWDLLSKNGFEGEEIAQKAFGILDSAHNLPPTTKSSLQSACTRFLTQATNGRLTDPVMKIIYQRLKGHVFSRVSATSSQERVRAASTASEGLASAGIPEFTAQVSEIVDILSRVSEVDWKSHGVWYDQIAQEVSSAGEA